MLGRLRTAGTMIGSMAPGVMPGAMGSLPMPMQTLQPYGGLMPGGMPPMPAPTPPTMTLDDHGSGYGFLSDAPLMQL